MNAPIGAIKHQYISPSVHLRRDFRISCAEVSRLGRFAGSGSSRKLIAVMYLKYEAYLDASGGKDKGQPTVAFAGLLSPARDWLRFNREWCRALNEDNLPPFHASEFLGQHGDFRDMTDEVQQRVLPKLIKTLTDRCWYIFGGAIETAQYEQLLSPETRRVFWTPEQFAFFICMLHIVNRMEKKPPDEDVAVIVDQDDPVRRHNVDKAYGLIIRNEEFGFRFRGLSFGDRKRVVPLQGADLVVNQVFRHQRDGRVTQEQLRPLLRSILDLVPSDIITAEPVFLRYIDEGIREIAKRGLTYDPQHLPKK